MGYKAYKVNDVDYIYIPDPPPTAPNQLYVELAAAYNNQTVTPTDIVTGSLTTNGGDVLVQASGSVFCSNAQNDAIIDNLTDDSAIGTLQLYIDGVAHAHATAQIQAAPVLNGGTWFQVAQQTCQIFVRVSGLAAGAHTFAIKGKVTVPAGPNSSLLQIQATANQPYNFNMLVTEL